MRDATRCVPHALRLPHHVLADAEILEHLHAALRRDQHVGADQRVRRDQDGGEDRDLDVEDLALDDAALAARCRTRWRARCAASRTGASRTRRSRSALQIPSCVCALRMSVDAACAYGASGALDVRRQQRGRGSATTTSVRLGRRLVEQDSARPQTRSRTNGTAASRMLNAMPPARNSTLSSPALSQTRFA